MSLEEGSTNEMENWDMDQIYTELFVGSEGSSEKKKEENNYERPKAPAPKNSNRALKMQKFKFMLQTSIE